MKGTKELLILAIPLMAAGCSGSGTGTSPPPPPLSVDPEGIFQGAAGNGDTIFGVVTADGAANFLEFAGNLTALTPSTPFIVLAPKAIVPDENGNYSVSYNGYSGNHYMLPSGDINETGTFSGLAQVAASLSGSYTVTGAIPTGAVVNPQTTSSVNYNLAYQPSLYEAPSSANIIAGNYSLTIIVANTEYTSNSFTITAGTSTTQATISGSVSSCNLSGTVTTPDTNYNAYQFSIQSSGAGCPLSLDNLAGNATYLNFNSVPTVFAFLQDKAIPLGALLVLTPLT